MTMPHKKRGRFLFGLLTADKHVRLFVNLRNALFFNCNQKVTHNLIYPKYFIQLIFSNIKIISNVQVIFDRSETKKKQSIYDISLYRDSK